MAESRIFEVFQETGCDSLLAVSDNVVLGRSVTSQLSACMQGKRKRFPFLFVAGYPGDGSRRIGLSIHLRRKEGKRFSLSLYWFVTEAEPPKGAGSARDFFECVSGSLGESEFDITVAFSYDKERVGSLFKRIQLAQGSTIFDEIIGFAGAKRGPNGKLLYTMNVGLGQKSLVHIVQFRQSVRLHDDLPLLLIQSAARISGLALEKKGGSSEASDT